MAGLRMGGRVSGMTDNVLLTLLDVVLLGFTIWMCRPEKDS